MRTRRKTLETLYDEAPYLQPILEKMVGREVRGTDTNFKVEWSTRAAFCTSGNYVNFIREGSRGRLAL